jgi:hypothetical protein
MSLQLLSPSTINIKNMLTSFHKPKTTLGYVGVCHLVGNLWMIGGDGHGKDLGRCWDCMEGGWTLNVFM